GLPGGDRIVAWVKPGQLAVVPALGHAAGVDRLELCGLTGMLPAVGLEALLPLGLDFAAALATAAEVLECLLRHVEMLVRVPAVGLLGQPHLVLPQGIAVRARGV